MSDETAADLAAARVEVDRLRDDLARAERLRDGWRATCEDNASVVDALRVEVDTLRAKIGEATAAGIGAARIGKEIAIRHEYDAWLSELRDIEKQLMTLARAVPGTGASGE